MFLKSRGLMSHRERFRAGTLKSFRTASRTDECGGN
jgi:hypothetical protein